MQGKNTGPEPVAETRTAIDAEDPVAVELPQGRHGVWNRVTIAPITDETGTITHYVGFQEDVTERVEYQQMLRRFQRAVEAAGHAVCIRHPSPTSL
jgi:signal transduction histidine kinase